MQSNIQFRQYTKYQVSELKKRTDVEVAFLGDGSDIVENSSGVYLSRISQKNGKHRYYLTREFEEYICNGCGTEDCRSRSCRGGWERNHYFQSKYVGKDLNAALDELLLSPGRVNREKQIL